VWLALYITQYDEFVNVTETQEPSTSGATSGPTTSTATAEALTGTINVFFTV